jgi:hypothetical protein
LPCLSNNNNSPEACLLLKLPSFNENIPPPIAPPKKDIRYLSFIFFQAPRSVTSDNPYSPAISPSYFTMSVTNSSETSSRPSPRALPKNPRVPSFIAL